MARKKTKRQDWRMVLFLALSALIVLSMLLSLFLIPK